MRVKRKTSEEFHMWLELQIEDAKRAEAQLAKMKKK